MRAALVVIAVTCGACAVQPPPEEAPPQLRAGVATVALDAPVGVAMGGYDRTSGRPPSSPWVELHHASIGVHQQPTARALALVAGSTKVVLVRVDLCLSVATLRWRAQELLEAQGIDAPLIVLATHTHSAPARYFHPAPVAGSGGFDPTRAAMDSFDPEVELRLARSIARAASLALEGTQPVAVGVASVAAPELNSDRRCENDDLYGAGFRDSTLTVVRFDALGADGQPTAPLTGLVHYALHGTFLDEDNLLLTVDAPGALELWGSDAVGVPLLFMQGAAGDVSPSTGPLGHGEFQAMERLGRLGAKKVREAWERAAPVAAPAGLQHFAQPFEPSRSTLGYAPGEFAENGAVGCGLGAGRCPPVEVAPESIICLPLARRPFRESTIEAVRVGSVLLATLPGEPTAAIGERVKAAGGAVPGVTNVLAVGYAQDHFGYLLEPKDYLRLGYEAYVSPLGWRFGDFTVGQAEVAFEHLGAAPLTLRRPEVLGFEPRVTSASAGPAQQVGVVNDVRRLETASFVFEGGDPALGTPQVALEREVDGAFVAVRASPVRLIVGGPELVSFYEPEPTWAAEPLAPERHHRWRVQWETTPDTALGRYRLVATGTAWRSETNVAYLVASNAFSVTASDRAGQTMRAHRLDGGALALTFRFPPNPTLRDPTTGAPVGNFRLRDEGSRPSEGARVRGGVVHAVLEGSDGGLATFDWSERDEAYIAQGVATPRLVVPPGGVVDGWGNTNSASMTATVP